jgi:hypothetical protein
VKVVYLLLGILISSLAWAGQVSAETTVVPQTIIFSELAWAGSSVSTADEWLELKNLTSSSIDLTGWNITIHRDGDKEPTVIPFWKHQRQCPLCGE